MIWELIKMLFGGIWSVLKMIPLRAWLIAALIAAAWWWHSGKVEAAHDAGVQEERTAWVKAQDKAKRDAKEEAERQQAKIDKEAAASKEAADKRIATAKAETESLREKLRHANQSKPDSPPGDPDRCRISPERRDLLNQALGYD